MASEIRIKPITKATFTCTLASLANAAARQSTMINNSSNYPAAIVTMKIKSSAAAPTVGTLYEIYLLRGDDAASSTYRSDAAGASDATITIENAQLIAAHESPRTTKLYDRTADAITLDEIERIAI